MQNQATMGYTGNQPGSNMQVQQPMVMQPTYIQQAPEYATPYGQPAYQPQPGQVMMGSPVPSKGRSLEVIVPNGAFGGSVLQITDPQTRQAFQVTVPAGLQPGMKFEVQLQAPAGVMYQAPQQQPMVYQQQPTKSNDDCGAFLMGMCFCCTLCCLAGDR